MGGRSDSVPRLQLPLFHSNPPNDSARSEGPMSVTLHTTPRLEATMESQTVVGALESLHRKREKLAAARARASARGFSWPNGDTSDRSGKYVVEFQPPGRSTLVPFDGHSRASLESFGDDSDADSIKQLNVGRAPAEPWWGSKLSSRLTKHNDDNEPNFAQVGSPQSTHRRDSSADLQTWSSFDDELVSQPEVAFATTSSSTSGMPGNHQHVSPLQTFSQPEPVAKPHPTHSVRNMLGSSTTAVLQEPTDPSLAKPKQEIHSIISPIVDRELGRLAQLAQDEQTDFQPFCDQITATVLSQLVSRDWVDSNAVELQFKFVVLCNILREQVLGVHMNSACLWSPEMDLCVAVRVCTKGFICILQVFGIQIEP